MTTSSLLKQLGQALIAAYFAIRWLPREPRPAARVLALQIAAAIAALLPVFILDL